MLVNGRHGNAQAAGYLSVRAPAPKLCGDVELSLGEPMPCLRRSAATGHKVNERTVHALVRQAPDSGDHLGDGEVFRQVAVSARLTGGRDRLEIKQGGDHDHHHTFLLIHQLSGGGKAVFVGPEVQIKQEDVHRIRGQSTRHLRQGAQVPGDVQAALALEQPLQPNPKSRVVINYP